MSDKATPPEKYRVLHALRRCSMSGCPNVVTHFAYKVGDWDGRVWCRNHRREAERRS